MSEFRSHEHSGAGDPPGLRPNQTQSGENRAAPEQDPPSSVADLLLGDNEQIQAHEELMDRHSNDLSLVDIPSMAEVQPLP